MKAGRMLRSVLILFLSYPVLILCKVTQLENCLLDGQVLYKDSEDCLSLLEQGPCDSGQQMVMGAGYKGECQEHITCPSDEVEIIDHEKGAVCGCPDGKVRMK